MKKTRIVTRVKDKTGISKSKNRSGDLSELQQRFQAYTRKLKLIIRAVQSNHTAMVAHSAARLEVAKAVNALTVDTPLFACGGDIGQLAGGNTGGNSEGGGPASASNALALATPQSYSGIHLTLFRKTKIYHDKYQEHVLNYAIEWERVLTNRVTAHLKQSEKLRVDLDHYQTKVEELQKSANVAMSKGKSVDEKSVDKIRRNETKLINARQDYDRFISDLCGFIEEVMDRGWKDLHPLLVKMAQFDATLSTEEANSFRAMNGVTEQLKELSSKHSSLTAQGRLKELETWPLSKILNNTAAEPGLMITAGPSDSPPPSTDELAEELGVGGGGLFGTLNKGSSNNLSRANSGIFSSRSRTNTGDSNEWNSSNAWSTSNNTSIASPTQHGLPPLVKTGSSVSNSVMPYPSAKLSVAQAAAPAPTLDDIFGAAATNNAAATGLSDMYTTSSFQASGTAQPVGMPPPPPNMPPPPPPQSQGLDGINMGSLSVYDSYNNTGGTNNNGISFPSPVPPPLVPPPIPTTTVGQSQIGSSFGAYNTQIGGGFLTPSNQSASTNTNPFADDDFGGYTSSGATSGVGTFSGVSNDGIITGYSGGNTTPTTSGMNPLMSPAHSHGNASPFGSASRQSSNPFDDGF